MNWFEMRYNVICPKWTQRPHYASNAAKVKLETNHFRSFLSYKTYFNILGIICLEGKADECNAAWATIKAMTWKKIALKYQEVSEYVFNKSSLSHL